MPKKKLAILRTDASVVLGNGHIVRCLALADALASGGWFCLFAISPETLTVFPALLDTDHSVLLVECDEEEEPGFIGQSLSGPCALLVVDHYRRDAKFEAACRTWAGGIVVIDDLSDRPHECDVLLDQNQLRAEEVYRSLIPSEAIVLAGPGYAMLRQQFFSLRFKALKKFEQADQVKNILVSFGSTDLQNLSSVALQVISEISSSITIDVSIGSGAPNLKRLQSLGWELPNDVKIHVDHADMAGLMIKADMAVGAAGLTAWERCCIGLPSIAVITAGNQKKVAVELSNHGAATVIDARSRDVRGALLLSAKSLIRDPKKRINMSARAGSICDGLGVRRVLQALDATVATNGTRVQLRPATLDDAFVIYDWQSAPMTRRYARDNRVPGKREHFKWMRKRLSDAKCIFNMIEIDHCVVGVLRLDHQSKAEESGDEFEISIFVDPKWYRQGVALRALYLARDLVPRATIAAHVHADNIASLQLFSRAGYQQRGEWFFSESIQ